MYKAKIFGGIGLQNRKKAKLITVMAVAILSIFILGCPNDGGPGPVTPPGSDSTVTAVTIAGDSVVIKSTSNITKQYTVTVTGENNPSQAVTWSVEGTTPTGVEFSDGTLTVKANG